MPTIPTKWKVRITEANREVLEQWRIKQPRVEVNPKITCLVDNSLNRWLVSEIYDGSYLHWGDALEYKEITYEQFKQFILMKNEFTPIAMKCNQEQFDAIKPILEKHGMKIVSISPFDEYPYLTNDLGNRQGLISNVGNYAKNSYNRTVYELWNQDTFLEACGIETNQKTKMKTYKFKSGDKVRLKQGITQQQIQQWCDERDISFPSAMVGDFNHALNNPNHCFEVAYLITKFNNTFNLKYNNDSWTWPMEAFEPYVENNTKMKTYLTKISDLKKIHDVACGKWKSRIKALITDPFAESIELTQTQVDAMFKAATTDQRPVLVEVFGEPAPKHNFKKGEVIWVWDNHHQYPNLRAFIEMRGVLFMCVGNNGKGDCPWDNAAPFNNGQLPDEFKHLLNNQ